MADATDVLVIGGGPGGYAAAFRAADLGLDVTLITDEPMLGGVCLRRGCIPSKALLDAADRILRAREDTDRGLAFAEPELDLDRLREWKDDDVVGRLTDGLDRIAAAREVAVVHARARFEEPGVVALEAAGDSDAADRLEYEHAIIATGSRPVPLPDTGFGGRIWSSAEALDVPEVPDRLLVVGGGYIGLEMGTVYAALGSAVTMVEMADRLMPRADADLVEPVRERCEARFEGVHTGVTVTSVEADDDGVTAEFDGDDPPSETAFDAALVAIGRAPTSDGLGLDAVGVETDEDGFIVVDEQRRTSADGIHAIGDVAGGNLLAHEAMREGKVAAGAIAGEPTAFDNRAVPAVVYTDPQVAWCGLTEREAAAEDREVDVAVFPWSAAGRALSMGADGRTKLLLDPETGAILGAGVVGRGAESLIAEVVLAMEMGAVAEDLAATIHAHPTLPETVGGAAERWLGTPTHLPPG